MITHGTTFEILELGLPLTHFVKSNAGQNKSARLLDLSHPVT